MFSVSQETKKYMSIVVTHECNKNCPFCIDKYKGSGEFITIETVENILKIAKTNGIEDILVIGGEPTLHPEIIKICKLIKTYDFRLIMTTNYSRAEVVKKLDGIVDCFNISYYRQELLPRQLNMKSDITIHALIHKKQLMNKCELDLFINRYSDYGHLKFSTLTVCNEWTKYNQISYYLDDLDCEWVVLFNEMIGQIYRGCVVKRYDKILNKRAHQSLKAHVNGEISFSWNRTEFN